MSSSTQSDPLCISTASTAGNWSCAAPTLPSGPNITIRVVQLVPGYDNSSDAVTVNVLNAPTIASGSGTSQTTGFGTVRGTAYPGATVTASAGSYSCSYVADALGGWSCNLGTDIPSGTLTARATQSTSFSGTDSDPSAALTLQVDSDAPAVPVVLTPAAGATVQANNATFTGTGEGGALVTVFAGPFAACTATVLNTSWSCTSTGVPVGSSAVSALQQDAAGNVGPESAGHSVVFAASTPSATPGDAQTGTTPTATAPGSAGTPPSSGSASPGGPVPGASTAPGSTNPSNGGSGSGSGSSSSPAPATPGAGVPGPGSAAPPRGDARQNSGNWAASTPFSSAVSPVFSASSPVNWWLGLVLAILLIVCVAAPARLVFGAISHSRTSGRLDSDGASRGSDASPTGDAPHDRRGRLGLTGRNRPRDGFDTAPDLTLNPWILAGAAIVASAAIGMLSGPVESQPAYLRLLAAMCVASAVVNIVSAVIPNLLARPLFGTRTRISDGIAFAPRYLLIAAAASLVSRLLNLEPAFLFGLVVTVSATGSLGTRMRGQRGLLHIGTLLVLGSVAWAVVSLLHPDAALMTATATATATTTTGTAAAAATTAGGAFVAEVLNTIVLGSFGAAAVMVLPFGGLSGRSLLAWSKPVWLATTLTTVTVFGVLLATNLEHLAHLPAAVGLVLTTIGFAAVSVSVWAWLKFIAPALK
ncbi:hypothetical protein GCM10009563_19000 [Subtercola frigoramans]